MELQKLKPRPEISTSGAKKAYSQLSLLVEEIRNRKLSQNTIVLINEGLDDVNQISSTDSKFKNQVKKKIEKTLEILKKEEELVPVNYYQNYWMALGMATIGLPFGVAFGTAVGNIAFLGIGLPIGMAIGMGIGAEKDKKAKQEERQLKFEQKY